MAYSSLVYGHPGQTAATMIQQLGPLTNRYESPPVPSRADLKAGRDKLDGVYWFGVDYDPVSSGHSLTGNLVAVFQYPAEELLQHGAVQNLNWSDITSHSEVFLAFVSDRNWADISQSISNSWTLDGQREKRNPDGSTYSIFDYISLDKSLRLQISYTPERKEGTDPGNDDSAVFNFWSRVAPVEDPEWR